MLTLLSVMTLSSELNAQKRQNKQQDNLKGEFTFGGYGEITMSRHFYSDAWQRYALPQNYKDDKGFGRFDVPHAVFFVGYNFGKGWSFGTEIEFEHGGTGMGIEIEEEETGEYESEVEQGGEIALEQFWINKSWNKSLNLKMGHLLVPVGLTNKHHLPTEYFGVFRPEGDDAILPCAWHETGLSFWGSKNDWSYEAMFIAGLDADRFSPKNWIGSGSGTPYEFKIANDYAGALRVDNRSVKNLTIGISGYYGHSARNSLNNYGYGDLSGAVAIGSLDFIFNPKDFILRGGVIYGHLNNSYEITTGNAGATNNSPTPGKPAVASDAISVGLEAGYNLFGLCDDLTAKGQKLWLFGRYDYYDSMLNTVQGVPDYAYWKRMCYTVGLNYSPMKEIVIKTQYNYRSLDKPYNNEPSFSLGITWAGLFVKSKNHKLKARN